MKCNTAGSEAGGRRQHSFSIHQFEQITSKVHTKPSNQLWRPGVKTRGAKENAERREGNQEEYIEAQKNTDFVVI